MGERGERGVESESERANLFLKITKTADIGRPCFWVNMLYEMFLFE